MSTPATIRDATPSDMGAIAALLAELYMHEGMNAAPNAAELAQALFTYRDAVKLSALVAQTGGAVVGALLYYPGYDTTSVSYGYHLADMVVGAPHRAQGTGRAMVVALAARALTHNYQWISLTALGTNNSAAAFYESLGMTQVDVKFFAMGRVGLTALVKPPHGK